MRIDFSASEAAETVGVAAPGAAKTGGTVDGGAVSSEPEDTASLSLAGASLSALSAQALSSADARTAKVDALRGAVTNGTFALDPDRIADALIAGSA